MRYSKTAAAIAIISMAMILTGCVSTSDPYTLTAPVSASVSFPAAGDYEILGRVTYVSVPGDASYEKLLDMAKAMYPGTTDVVNVTVDASTTYVDVKDFWNGVSSTRAIDATYTMRGIAIHIKGAE